MSNYFHWLIQVKEEATISRFTLDLGTFFSSYIRAIQLQQARSGSLFQQHYRLKELANPNYLLRCFCYIHQNPLRAALESEPGAWPWSSFRDYAGLRSGQLCAKATATELPDLPADPTELRKLMLQTLPDDTAELLH